MYISQPGDYRPVYYSHFGLFFFPLMHYQRLFLHILVYTIATMKKLQLFVHNGTFVRTQLEGLTWANAGWVTRRSHLQIMAVLHCIQTWLPHSCVIYPQGFKLRTRMTAASFLEMFLYHSRLPEQLIFPPQCVQNTDRSQVEFKYKTG